MGCSKKCRTLPGGLAGGSIVEHSGDCESATAKVLRGMKVIKVVVPKGKVE